MLQGVVDQVVQRALQQSRIQPCHQGWRDLHNHKTGFVTAGDAPAERIQRDLFSLDRAVPWLAELRQLLIKADQRLQVGFQPRHQLGIVLLLLAQCLHPYEQPGQRSPDVMRQRLHLFPLLGGVALELCQQHVDAVCEQLQGRDAVVDHERSGGRDAPWQGFEELFEWFPQLPSQEHNQAGACSDHAAEQ